MKKYKYLILGAGPSGLSLAHTLKNYGEESFLVIEKEAVAGGLCRSEIVDNAPLDIGGGHFLDIKRQEVLDLLFQFMPHSEWQEHKRISKIKIRGTEIDYPLEANLWQLPLEAQLDFIESIARAGCVCGIPMPESFEEWISWKLGKHIAEEYMLPYNRKIWSMELNKLGTYWLYKLPDVSFRETILSCLEKRLVGTLPAHNNFFYPQKHGYGEVWKRMGVALDDHLIISTPVTSIDNKNLIINDTFKADKIITTIPWTLWPNISDLPTSIKDSITTLCYASIDVDYNSNSLSTDAHWIYDPDEHATYHRILCRSNFCKGSNGYWTETNSLRSLEKTGWRYRNEYAYPINLKGKEDIMRDISLWAAQNNIIGLGRWGTWEHMNSDVAVSLGIALAMKLIKGID